MFKKKRDINRSKMIEFLGKHSPDKKLADLHIHTTVSDGVLTPQQVVELAANIRLKTQKLSALAITDHEVIDGALIAEEYRQAQGYEELEIVVGSEISTKDGHLVGLYLNKNIPSGKSAEWTIQAIHDQGGLVMAPHPTYKWTRSLGEDKIREILTNSHSEIFIDAFEVYNWEADSNLFIRWLRSLNQLSGNENGAALGLYPNNAAREFYLLHGDKPGAAVGGTDAHHSMIGLGLTGYTGRLREALTQGLTNVLYLSSAERLKLTQTAEVLFKGMVFEPSRRIKRYAERKINGLD